MITSWEKMWRLVYMSAAALGIAWVIWSLLGTPRTKTIATTMPVSGTAQGPLRIEGSEVVVSLDSPLYQRLEVHEVQPQTVSRPLVVVTGSVIARIRSGPGTLEDRWQFVSSELSAAYADLLKSRADADFARDRLQKTRELAAAQEAHYQTIVNRLTNITSGSVALKELTAAQADLLRTQLQDQKDIYAEESALRVARQQLASDERELAQQGLEPEVLSRARDGMVLISASVPESKIALVQENQSCQARFYGFPEKLYSGHVEHLGSVLNSQRRTLRVLFDLTDDDEVLRPGMFADVYLGTDERTVILIPNDALVHLGRFQYVFRELQSGRFEVVRVEAAEPLGGFREIRTGLRPGDRIVTQGAILLKPMAAQIVGRPST